MTKVPVYRLPTALSAEYASPVGQAAEWYQDVVQYASRSGQHVARQVARLCGHDSEVTISWRSLADAVQVVDKKGRKVAYAQRGVAALIDIGWLEKETVGRGRGAKTTFRLMPGDVPGYASQTAA